MVFDTSALLTILLGEPEAEAMIRAVAREGVRLIGAPTLVEASGVMRARKGPGGEVALDSLLERTGTQVVPMSLAAAKLARLAYNRWGKGVGEPAVLNLGDCLAYGVAMAEQRPLMFRGDDFAQTDVTVLRY
jgi:ribonuclease VapC